MGGKSTTTRAGLSTIGTPVDTRTSTVVVAASNSLDPTLAPLLYRCTGVNDEVEMNAALVAAAAVNGSVELLEGDYNTVLTLIVAVNVTLKAVGWGAVINFNAGGNAITITGDNVKLRDFKIVIVAGAGGAGTRPNCILADTRNNLEITNLWLIGDNTVADDGSDLRQCGIVFTTVTYSKILFCTSIHNIRYGVLLITKSNNNMVTGNTCNENARGINLHTTSIDNMVTDNTCNTNTEYGILLITDANYNILTVNICNGNTEYGIVLLGCSDNRVTDNTCNKNVKDGIYLLSGCTKNMILGNTCDENDVNDTGTYDGIRIDANSDDNTVMCNTCKENDRFGIRINNVNCQGNWVVNNRLIDNTSGPFSDLGGDTRLKTIPLYIVTYNTDSETEDGPIVNGAGEWVSFVGQLPLEVQQVVRFEIWAVGLEAPGADNQMCLTIEIEGGASDQPKTTHDTGALAGQLSEEINFAINDIIHWICINVNALALLGGDSVKCACRYNAAVASDIATNAAFRRVLAHIV